MLLLHRVVLLSGEWFPEAARHPKFGRKNPTFGGFKSGDVKVIFHWREDVSATCPFPSSARSQSEITSCGEVNPGWQAAGADTLQGNDIAPMTIDFMRIRRLRISVI